MFVNLSICLSVCLSGCLYIRFSSYIDYWLFFLTYFVNFLFKPTATPTSWNVTVYSITSSSARVRWPDFPLPLSISHYLVRFKETNGVSTIYRASSHSTTYYTNRLNGYRSYDVQVFAFTTSDGNITYSSQIVSIQTLEGGKNHLPLPAATHTAVKRKNLTPLPVFIASKFAWVWRENLSDFWRKVL